ncbi:DNA binding domain protein, excisionase family [Segniliparus rotundus DSM 44985]|uniref:DNA binding domain protein, excisionase family n=1 Tax=Segniliparus rotundus (strain ATCC BAA-972 / CDC 1076 / CIP 108378 / DSM 44985 / JCM 13578) TaxID=640132 RepID=D6ZAQ5_SEGRD|nr:helix-turn-helix domain-containing protein [Segniliparus rotundus]ADG98791.1 DNA binding domain protein, excisionase family [Segniliparus rotundus DSM 44985]
MSAQSPWLTVQEAADYARRHPVTVRAALSSGQLKGYRRTVPGGTWSIRRDDLEAWLTQPPVQRRRKRPNAAAAA